MPENQPPTQKLNKNARNTALMLIIFIGLFAFVLLFNNFSGKPPEKLAYSEFQDLVIQGEIRFVTIVDDEIILGKSTENDKTVSYETRIPYDDNNLLAFLQEYDVKVIGKKTTNVFQSPMVFIFLFLGVIILWFVLMRNMQGPGNRALSFGKSRAKLHHQNKKKQITFDDVAGCNEVKEELCEIIDFLKEPKKFIRIGARIPKGILLVGRPGTGKTLLARAIAGEADVPFYSISGSDFVEMFVGVGASRIRDLFNQAKSNSPCIIFMDELDAVGRQRGAGLGGGHDEREQTLNQLLVEMDGFDKTESVILIAATNRPDVLDPALLRPGRFDRQIVVDMPDIKGRQEILNVHAKKIKLASAIDFSKIARGTPGFSGAELENLINEAALLAARKNKTHVDMEDFENAKDRVYMGPERRSLVITDAEKKITAYHEAGHALIGMLLEHTDIVHKVTIIPRGRALGITWSLPAEEKHNYPKEYWLDALCHLLSGRVAEEIAFNTITTGAENDIRRATEIARNMVTSWGMSTKIGTMNFKTSSDYIFLGREIAQHKDYSEKTAQLIDAETKTIITTCYRNTKKILTKNKSTLKKLANTLIAKEILDSNAIIKVIGVSKIHPLKQKQLKKEKELTKETKKKPRKSPSKKKNK